MVGKNLDWGTFVLTRRGWLKITALVSGVDIRKVDLECDYNIRLSFLPMSFDLVALGNKLRRYRVQLQLSVEDVSAATGIGESILLRIEGGIERPSGDQILILADFFRCDYKFFISNERLAPFEQTENLYRRYGGEFSPSDRRSVQDFLYLCENEHFLQGALALSYRPLPTINLEGKIFKKHGAQAANQARVYLGYQMSEPPKSEIFQDLRKRHLTTVWTWAAAGPTMTE
jgi:transcriptional regulator with XRE-family HTH domain